MLSMIRHMLTRIRCGGQFLRSSCAARSALCVAVRSPASPQATVARVVRTHPLTVHAAWYCAWLSGCRFAPKAPYPARPYSITLWT